MPNRGFSLALQMINRHEDRELYALVPIPGQLDRFVRLPGDDVRFVLVEDVVLMFLDRLFPGFATLDHGGFRVIRDSEMEIDEEAEDLVKTFETALKRRRRGSVIRLSVDSSMPETLRDFVRKELGAAEEDVFLLDGLIGLPDTSEIIVDDRPELVFEPYDARFPGASSAISAAIASLPSAPRISSSTTPMRASTWWSSSCARRPATRMWWRSSRPCTGRRRTRRSSRH